MKKLSIKFRVTFWYTSFMLILAAIMLALAFVINNHVIKTGSRDVLIGIVENAGLLIEYDDGKLEEDGNLKLYSNGAYAAVFDAFGSEMLMGSLPPDFPGNVDYTERKVVVTDDWYVYDAIHNIDGYGSVIVRGVKQIDSTVNSLAMLVWIFMILLPFMILAATIGGYFITKRAFSPINNIIETAEQIQGGNNLSKRINLGEGKDEIYALANTFDYMFDRIEQSFKNEKQFTSDAAHELRTPVSVIISQCEYSIENESDSKDLKCALETVLDCAQNMSTLISKLLILARAENENIKSTFEKINLSELSQMCAQQISILANDKNIIVTTDIEPDIYIHGNETYLMRLILNLMDNGIKYGVQNGTLSFCLKKSDESIIGKITDNGIGIDKDKLNLIWNRFYQVDSSHSKYTGAGLGLSMAKHIVNAHDGEIWVESVKGKGSTFYFKFPLKNI